MLVTVTYDNPYYEEHNEYTSTLAEVMECFDGLSVNVDRVAGELKKSGEAVIKNGYATTTIKAEEENQWNPGDQANPAVMCKFCQTIDTPIGGDYIMTVSEEECKWFDRENHKTNNSAGKILDQIYEILDGKEWDSDTTALIAGTLATTGRIVRDPAP